MGCDHSPKCPSCPGGNCCEAFSYHNCCSHVNHNQCLEEQKQEQQRIAAEMDEQKRMCFEKELNRARQQQAIQNQEEQAQQEQEAKKEAQKRASLRHQMHLQQQHTGSQTHTTARQTLQNYSLLKESPDAQKDGPFQFPDNSSSIYLNEPHQQNANLQNGVFFTDDNVKSVFNEIESCVTEFRKELESSQGELLVQCESALHNIALAVHTQQDIQKEVDVQIPKKIQSKDTSAKSNQEEQQKHSGDATHSNVLGQQQDTSVIYEQLSDDRKDEGRPLSSDSDSASSSSIKPQNINLISVQSTWADLEAEINISMSHIFGELTKFIEWLYSVQKSEFKFTVGDLRQLKREADIWLLSIYNKAYIYISELLLQNTMESELKKGFESIVNCPSRHADSFRASLENALKAYTALIESKKKITDCIRQRIMIMMRKKRKQGSPVADAEDEHLEFDQLLKELRYDPFFKSAKECPFRSANSERNRAKLNTETLSDTDKFMRFDCVASLRMLLADDNLNVADEKEVFDFLVKWINHDRATRATHFDLLLNCVRFYQLSPRFLRDVVFKCDLITGSEEGRRRVEAVKDACFQFFCSRSTFAATSDLSLGSLLGVSVETPRTLRNYQMIVCVGGCDTNQLTSIELFDSVKEKWRLATGEMRLRSGRHGMGLVCVGAKMFVVGGHDGNSALKTVECFDLMTGEWSKLAPLKSARYKNALVALDEKWLYAIGGCGNGLYLRSVERYDIARNEWTEMAPMDAVRWEIMAAVHRGQIYVVGGFNGGALNSCERFVPIANRWTSITPMLHKRFCCGLAVLGDYLFAIGGNGVDGCCERYSFAENKWTEIMPLSTPRQQLSVAVVGSSIFAIGGLNGRQASKTVEVYDTLTGDKWTPSAPLNEPRFSHGVACSSSQFTENF